MKLSSKKELYKARTWVEINKDALLSNIAQIKKTLAPKTKFMAMVKANAYGHGLLEVAQIIKSKVDYFAVFTFEDALLLRAKNIKKPILVLSPIEINQIDLAIKHDIEIMVSNLDFIKKAKKKLKVHVCVDTGLGRDGFGLESIDDVISALKKSPLQVVGLYGHFAAADEKKFSEYSKRQIEEFLYWKNEFFKNQIKPKFIHHAASAGVFYDKNNQDFNMVRIGAGLYGLWPNQDRKKSIKLIPVLSWRARISEIKNLPKGSAISYGCTHILSRDSKLALLPVGYFDGISRLASNKASLLLQGKKIRQIGRITMNLIVLDITSLNGVKVGDVITIIGKDKKEEISADDWARWFETSNYEVVTRINPNIIRVQS